MATKLAKEYNVDQKNTLFSQGKQIVTVVATAEVAAADNDGVPCQSLPASLTRIDDHRFAPMIKSCLRLGDLLRLVSLHALGPELQEDLDDVGSPVLRLPPILLHGPRARELVSKPRSQLVQKVRMLDDGKDTN